MEIDYTIGAELEFYICSNEGVSVADMATGKFPQKQYEVSDKFKPQVTAYLDELKELGFEISSESGPGQFEVQFKPESDKSALIDNINKFKELSQELAEKHELYVTFAAKPFAEYCGNGLHIHISSSLFDPYGLIANGGVMQAKRDPENKYALWAIGGMLQRMRQHNVIFFPTEESRKRLVPYLNAPTKICWGRNNRSCAIRIPDSKPKRIEHRVAGADANPKSVIDAIISDMEYGINTHAEAGDPVFGNAWDNVYNFPLILEG